MDGLLDALAASAPAQLMRYSRWGYALASAGHVLGIALLVGAIGALDLRLLGVWRDVPLAPLGRVLVPVAATGLALAVATGALLFLADPAGYAGRPLFLFKIGLVAAAALHALAFHRFGGWHVAAARLRLAGTLSLLGWLTTLTLGRLLAFTEA